MGVRLTVVLAALVTVLSITACRQDTKRPDDPPATAKPAPPAAPAASPQPALTGAFEAISTTAMGISGDLTLTDGALRFTLGLTYETEPPAGVPAAQDYGKGADSWANLLGVPDASTVELRRVKRETVAPKAPNGGFCAPDAVTYLALGSAPGPSTSRRPSIRLAAFKGDTAPGPTSSATNLCGTFNYGPKP